MDVFTCIILSVWLTLRNIEQYQLTRIIFNTGIVHCVTAVAPFGTLGTAVTRVKERSLRYDCEKFHVRMGKR